VPHQRGYTLVEILLALILMLLVGGAMHGLLLSSQRLTRRQGHQAELQAGLRAGAIITANEFRELSTADILHPAPAALTYRAMRGVGFLCQTPTATSLKLARQGFTGHRDPQAGRDTVYVFLPDSEPNGTWLPLGITGVSTSSPCPGSQGPGITLSLPGTPDVVALEPGTPVRLWETMELRLYQSEGKSWLGARSLTAGEPIQPMVGPLTDGSGLTLEYLDGSGLPTGNPANIQGIRATLRAAENGVAESLSTVASLRNTLP
jgi:hypothetical protein